MTDSGERGVAVAPDAPPTDLRFLTEAIRDADAAAFAHVGDRSDPDLRYLDRFDGSDRPHAFVAVPGRATLCAPALAAEGVGRGFVAGAPDDGIERDVRTAGAGAPPGKRAAAALDALLGDRAGGTVLVPRHVPHDAAVYLERAGYDLRSTPAVAAARAVKSDAEVDRLRAAQRAATRAMARAESALAAAEADGGRLRREGAPLTVERLRRVANAALASAGVGAADATDVRTGGGAPDRRRDGTIRPGETVRIDLSPRGPRGYRGALARTFVVAGEGGWERRAHVAVEAARRAALAELDDGAGVSPSTVREEATAELTAYGFGGGETVRGAVRGVGLARREAPAPGADAPLEAGNAVALELELADPDEGAVRVADLLLVGDDGCEPLGEFPRSLAPEAR